MEKELGVTEARKALSDLVEKVQYQGDTYILSRHGKPAAAIVPVQVYENWKQNRDAFFNLIRDMQREADLEPGEAETLAAEAVLVVRGTSRQQP
jgi:prevent-host-death family protein